MASSTRWFALATLALSAFVDTVIADPPLGVEQSRQNERRVLNIRQNNKRITDEITATVAPDSICGYYQPQTQFSFTCEPGTSCMWENDRYNIAFCDETDFKLGCYNREDSLDNEVCDEECKKNPNNYFCTNSQRPHCYTIFFPDNIKKFACHTASGFSSMIFPDGVATYGTSRMDVYVIPATTTRDVSARGTTASNTDEDTATEAPGGPSVTSDAATTSATSDGQDDGGDSNGGGGSKTPIGAIVGGVVGGLAVIAAVVLGVFCIRRRTKTDKTAAASPAAGAPPQPMQQAPHQAPIAPNAFNDHSQYQKYQQYPDYAQQQQQQYPQDWQQQQQQQHMYNTSQSPPPMHGSPDTYGYAGSSPSNAPVLVEAPGHESNPVPVYEMGDKR